MFRAEVKKMFTSKFMIVTFVAVSIIPLIYGLIFLKSMWDPYGSLKDFPVAVVNLDQKVSTNGEVLEVGNTFVNNLKEKKYMDFHFVDEATAKKGIEDGNYFLVITIPKDFSESAASVNTANPHKMKLDYTTSAGYNFVAMKMSDSAVEKIKSQLNEEVIHSYQATIFSEMKKIGLNLETASQGSQTIASQLGKVDKGINSLTSGLETAEDGSKKLSTGLATASSSTEKLVSGEKKIEAGAKSVQTGSDTLKKGVVSYTDGVKKAVDGIQTAKDGAKKLADNSGSLTTGATSLADNTKTLASSSKTLAEGAQKVTDNSKKLADGLSSLKSGVSKSQAQLVSGLEAAIASAKAQNDQKTAGILQLILAQTQQSKLQDSVNTLSDGATALNKGSKQVSDGASDLNSGAEKLSDGAGKVSDGVKSYTDGADTLSSGLDQLATATTPLKTKSTALVNGATTLDDGTSQLEIGLETLVDKTGQLSDGLGTLSDGSGTLASNFPKIVSGEKQLESGVAKLESGSEKLSESLSKGGKTIETQSTPSAAEIAQLQAPVVTEHTEKTPVKNNGTGMSPYMIAVGLWVGSLSMTIAFDLLAKSRKPKNAMDWWLGKFGILYLLGILQGVILYVGLTQVLGLEVANPLGVLLLFFVASIAFISINGFLTIALGKVGSFLSMILLVLQLGSAGGAYPLALTPKFFQVIHPFFPISHLVFGLREAISIGHSPLGELSVLVGFAVAFILLLVLYFTKEMRKEGREVVKA